MFDFIIATKHLAATDSQRFCWYSVFRWACASIKRTFIHIWKATACDPISNRVFTMRARLCAGPSFAGHISFLKMFSSARWRTDISRPQDWLLMHPHEINNPGSDCLPFIVTDVEVKRRSSRRADLSRRERNRKSVKKCRARSNCMKTPNKVPLV